MSKGRCGEVFCLREIGSIFLFMAQSCFTFKFMPNYKLFWDFKFSMTSKGPTCQCRRHKGRGFDPWIRKFPWRRAWQSTPVFLPRKSHGQRSLLATVHGVKKSWTQLKGLSMHACIEVKIDAEYQEEWLARAVPGIFPNRIHFSPSPHRKACFCCSVAQLCPTLCDLMDCSMPSFPALHQLPELAQTHVHWVSGTIQPSHPLLSPSPSAFSLSQHQGLFQWVGFSHQVAKGLELQLQHQPFQWIFRVDLL